MLYHTIGSCWLDEPWSGSGKISTRRLWVLCWVLDVRLAGWSLSQLGNSHVPVELLHFCILPLVLIFEQVGYGKIIITFMKRWKFRYKVVDIQTFMSRTIILYNSSPSDNFIAKKLRDNVLTRYVFVLCSCARRPIYCMHSSIRRLRCFIPRSFSAQLDAVCCFIGENI